MNACAQSATFSLYEIPPISVRSPMVAKKHNENRHNTTINHVETDSFSDLLYDVGANKNRESFIKLFNHFAPRIKSFLISGGLNRETADELAQETMLTIWRKAETYKPEKAKASTWIFTIARNKKIDHFRKYKRENIVDVELDIIKDDQDGAAKNMQRSQEKNIMASALKALPNDQADLIHKSFFEGKSHSQIAKETKIPLGTIKSRIRLALKRLRENVKIEGLK